MIDIDQNVNFSQSGCALNSQGFSICTESGTFSGPNLNAGTYWLNLQNAMVSNGDAVYFIWPYDAQTVEMAVRPLHSRFGNGNALAFIGSEFPTLYVVHTRVIGWKIAVSSVIRLFLQPQVLPVNPI